MLLRAILHHGLWPCILTSWVVLQIDICCGIDILHWGFCKQSKGKMLQWTLHDRKAWRRLRERVRELLKFGLITQDWKNWLSTLCEVHCWNAFVAVCHRWYRQEYKHLCTWASTTLSLSPRIKTPNFVEEWLDVFFGGLCVRKAWLPRLAFRVLSDTKKRWRV